MSQRIYAPSPSTFAEDPDRYRKDGLHPLIIGDTLKNGRYRIIHKLGSGSFATIWLCRDASENRYVSVKVLSAETPLDCKELQILEAITTTTVAHNGRDFVIQLLDHFTVEGPNGKHWCLVTRVAGDRLARKPGLPYNSLEWPRVASLQVAEALAFLHTLGIAHGGESISPTFDFLIPILTLMKIAIRPTFSFSCRILMNGPKKRSMPAWASPTSIQSAAWTGNQGETVLRNIQWTLAM